MNHVDRILDIFDPLSPLVDIEKWHPPGIVFLTIYNTLKKKKPGLTSNSNDNTKSPCSTCLLYYKCTEIDFSGIRIAYVKALIKGISLGFENLTFALSR